jgi:hypothetical protein
MFEPDLSADLVMLSMAFIVLKKKIYLFINWETFYFAKQWVSLMKQEFDHCTVDAANGITVNGIKFILIDKLQIIISYLMYVTVVHLLVSIGYRNQFLSVPKWSN